MSWIWLTVAIFFEVFGTASLKASEGLTKLTPSIITFVCYFICFSTLAFSLKTLDMSVAYAIWAGLGIALITLIGFIFFGEPITFAKTISILLIIAGVVGLNLFNQSAH